MLALSALLTLLPLPQAFPVPVALCIQPAASGLLPGEAHSSAHSSGCFSMIWRCLLPALGQLCLNTAGYGAHQEVLLCKIHRHIADRAQDRWEQAHQEQLVSLRLWLLDQCESPHA